MTRTHEKGFTTMNREEITDLYFMDARSKLIDLAAFLDRLDRYEGADDYRMAAFSKNGPLN